MSSPLEGGRGALCQPCFNHASAVPEDAPKMRTLAGRALFLSLHELSAGWWGGGNIPDFLGRKVSVVDCQQPEELQQLLVVWLDEVSRLLGTVVL